MPTSPDNTIDWLARNRIGRIVALLALLALPHMLWLPIWVSAFFIMAITWRLVMAHQGQSIQHRWLLHVMTVVGIAGVYVEYGSINGHRPGIALLVVMSGLKLLETRSQRDCRLLIFLGFLLLLGHLLNTQNLASLLWLALAVMAILAVLVDLQHPQHLRPLRRNLNLAAILAAKALPLALLFFVLFPRIPGPLWGIPADSAGGRTGLSDQLELGGIASLAQSDAVAFRVRFADDVPPNRELYWRALALVHFDGERWTARDTPTASFFPAPIRDATAPQASSSVATTGPAGQNPPRTTRDAVSYEIQMEPHGRHYLPSLDYLQGPLPIGTVLGPDYILASKSPLIDARLLALQATTGSVLPASVRPRWLSGTRALPPEKNPRTQEFAQFLRRSSASEQDFINQVLRHFRQQPFYYTLQPGRLRSSDRVDEFLFQSRRGFCEHYAAAFVVMMRAAGIPARIVTGYQGAERNGGYYIVRQSDAHAWAEVWLGDHGWKRFDPTAAIAPERVEQSLAAALPDSALLPTFARGNGLTARWMSRVGLEWDRVNELWNRTVLAYGPELQRSFLERFGMSELKTMLYALVIAIALFGAFMVAQLGWNNRPRRPADPLTHLRDQLVQKAGLTLADSQHGPLGIQQALQSAGQWNSETERLLTHYQRLRYSRSQPADATQVNALARAIRDWQPK